jgi:hypothetical protein
VAALPASLARGEGGTITYAQELNALVASPSPKRRVVVFKRNQREAQLSMENIKERLEV